MMIIKQRLEHHLVDKLADMVDEIGWPDLLHQLAEVADLNAMDYNTNLDGESARMCTNLSLNLTSLAKRL